MTRYDAVIVGAGPNGFAAAITLAQAGLSTLIVESSDVAGGGTRSARLTLPGFMHDECSAVHPLGIGSPFFRTLGLERHGLQWIEPAAPLAHVLSAERAVILERSVADTARGLGDDGPAYAALMEPLVREFDALLPMILAPLRVPERPWLMARFGWPALRSMTGLARAHFRGEAAPALLGGIAAHAMVPLDALATASFALVLAMAGHAVGWPVARGGSQAIADALSAHHRALGGELVLGQRVRSLAELPSARAYVLDVAPTQLAPLMGDALPAGYARRLTRFRYGPGVFKVDWALSGPIPWRDPACARAGTVHVAGSLASIALAQRAVHAGAIAERPFMLVGQPSVVDATRAPQGFHTAWAYCHVPHGSRESALAHMEGELERYAPGFERRVVARASRSAHEVEQHGPNYVGGDINGGLSDLRQLFFRPVAKLDPYAVPTRTGAPVFLCSSSTPPGGGVHGMCGHWAAKSALRHVFGLGR